MNLQPQIYLIVAADLKNGIGSKGKLPWVLKGDMKFFQKTTIKTDSMQYRNMVIMGRVTWDSIPMDHRPLKGRKNVIITHNKQFEAPQGVSVVHSIKEALDEADERIGNIFVIGGANIYDQFMKKQKIDGIYLTRVKREYKCDTFFPRIPKVFKPEKLGEVTEGGVSYEFLFYKKKR
jgi:dihydrofolate reductase